MQVGDPRDYKWITVSPLEQPAKQSTHMYSHAELSNLQSKLTHPCFAFGGLTSVSQIYEQMSIAIDRDASRVWVLNVGDLKPYERETEFFITLAWNSTRWNPDNLDTFVTSWAKREFALGDSDATMVADIVANLTRFNARRKPELLNGTTFSLINYREWVSAESCRPANRLTDGNAGQTIS